MPIRDLFASSAGFLVAVLAISSTLTLLSGEAMIGSIAWGIGYAILLFRQFKQLKASAWRPDFESQLIVRVIFCVGVAGLMMHAHEPFGQIAWLSLFFTLFFLWFSGGIPKFSRHDLFLVEHLPGVDRPSETPRWLLGTYIFSILAPPLLFLMAFVPLPQVLMMFVAVGMAFTVIRSFWREIYVSRASRRAEAETKNAIEKIGPSYALYWVSPSGARYQVAMWQKYLEKTGLPYIVVTRNRADFEAAVDVFRNRPVVLAPGLSDLDKVYVESIRAVLYVNHAALNAHSVRFRNLLHIQINHGDSEKESSYSPVTAMFDRNYVAGQAAIDRFTDHKVIIPAEKFRVVGRPQLEDVLRQDMPSTRDESGPTLYAPTWSGFFEDSSYSSLSVGTDLVRELLKRGQTIIFRPHPWSRNNGQDRKNCESIIQLLKVHSQRTGTPHLFGDVAELEMTITDCFNLSSRMISDISSVTSDYLYSLKPLAVMLNPRSSEEYIENWKLLKALYMLRTDSNNWGDALDEFLGPDPLRDVRLHMRSYYLGDFPASTYATQFIRTLQEDISVGKRV